MQVTDEQWKSAMNNLLARREEWKHADDNRKLDNAIRDYKTHMSKVFIGDSLLDVGCGNKFMQKCIPPKVAYFGLDAFPVDTTVYNGKIEDDAVLKLFTKFYKIDTVCAFAVLDGCQDLDKAISNIKTIALKNVVILTGINIEVDRFHTFKIEMKTLDDLFEGWNKTYCEELKPKVLLIEYSR